MVATVYLIRHGRTALNAAGVLRGRIDEPLDDAGRAEALRLGSLFAAVRLTRIISSPLKRSFETASALAQPHGLAVVGDPAFLDRDYGPWAGRSQHQLVDRYGSVDAAPADEVESRNRFESRVVTALRRVAGQADGEFVAVVAHDAVNRVLIQAVCPAQREAAAELSQPTGCWNRLIFDAQEVMCDVVGAVPGDGVRPG